MHRWQGGFILVLALLCGLALRVVMVSGRTVLSHDGAISYLAATGHAAKWHETTQTGSERSPYATWVRSGRWKAFITAEAPFSPRRIARDLSLHDLHPPLYFWLLHFACRVFGTHEWTGPLVNVLIDGLGIVVIFGAARSWLDDSRWAALAALLWAVSPAALETMQIARHYSLLGLVSTAFAWQFVRIIDSRRPAGWLNYAVLALVICAGTLTHLFFAAVIFAAIVLAALRAHRRVLGGLILSTLAGLAMTLAADPWLISVVTRSDEIGGQVTLASLTTRVLKVGFHFFDLPGNTTVGNAILAFALTAWVTAVFVRHPRGERLRTLADQIQGPDRNPYMPLALLVFLCIGAAYIGFFVPWHAIGPNYLASVWPLMAIGVIASLRHLPARRTVLAALVVFALTNAIWHVADFHARQAQNEALVKRVSAYDHLLVDQVARGALLPLVHELGPHANIYAAQPEDIIARVEGWEPRLRDARGRKAYVSNVYMSTTREDRAAIRDLLEKRGWEVPQEGTRLLPTWRLYELER